MFYTRLQRLVNINFVLLGNIFFCCTNYINHSDHRPKNLLVPLNHSLMSHWKENLETNLPTDVKFSGNREKRDALGSGGLKKTPYCPLRDHNANHNRPLLCYQCRSEARQSQAICDNTLWHFAEKADINGLSVRCPNNNGTYCVKMVQEKAGIRLTTRGCFGAGPVINKKGKWIPLNEGCAVYDYDEYITTTCLCQKDLCNFSNILRGSMIQIMALVYVTLHFSK